MNNMNKSTKYDPEDIESLMLHKSFEELYPEEKEFVLRYIDSKEEYNSMRDTLAMVKDSNTLDSPIEPKENIKEDLLAAFQTEKKKGFIVWLNGILPFSSSAKEPFYWRPMFQVGLTSLILLLGLGYFLWQNNPTEDGKNIAELKEKTEKTEKTENKSEVDSKSSAKESPKTEETLDIAKKDFKNLEGDKETETITENNRMMEDNASNELRDEALLIAELDDFDEEENSVEMEPAMVDEVESEGLDTYFKTNNADNNITLKDVETTSPTAATTLSNVEIASADFNLGSTEKSSTAQLHSPLSEDFDLISMLYTAP